MTTDTGGPLTLAQINEIVNPNDGAFHFHGTQYSVPNTNTAYLLTWGRDPQNNAARWGTLNPMSDFPTPTFDGIPVMWIDGGGAGGIGYWAAIPDVWNPYQPGLTADQTAAASGYGPEYLKAAYYVPNVQAALAEADDGGGFLGAIVTGVLGAMVAAAGVDAFSAMNAAGAGASESVTLTGATGTDTLTVSDLSTYGAEFDIPIIPETLNPVLPDMSVPTLPTSPASLTTYGTEFDIAVDPATLNPALPDMSVPTVSTNPLDALSKAVNITPDKLASQATSMGVSKLIGAIAGGSTAVAPIGKPGAQSTTDENYGITPSLTPIFEQLALPLAALVAAYLIG